MTPEQGLLLAQGAYYAAAGLWPVFHMRSFLRVTGPKTDRWLVKTAGLLIAAIGVSLLVAAGAPPSASVLLLAVGSALALGAVDVVYSFKGVISPVYLADAAAEAALLAVWVGTLRKLL